MKRNDNYRGKAKPSISQILSKSKNIEIKCVLESAKLSKKILD